MARPSFLLCLLICFLNLYFFSAAYAIPIYKDPSQPIEDRVHDLLSRMTLAEKIGQMTQIERSVCNESVMQEYFIGSVLNGGGSAPGENAMASASNWADMVDSFQRGALGTRLGIPMIYGIDAVHGNNNIYGATIFPHNIGLGATGDSLLMQRIGEAVALEVRATGIPWAFAPCIAVCRDPRWGRCYESFGEDTALVARFGAFMIAGLQGINNEAPGMPHLDGQTHVAACGKHFVGDGGTMNGINENNTQIDFRSLMRIHMAPYFAALQEGVSTIMISYSSWNGKKMHAQRDLITRTLKRQLGFKGFTVSDWQGIDRITDPAGSNLPFSVFTSISAGLDMIMVPFEFPKFITTLRNQVEKGLIGMPRIDDAVSRILRVKFRMGLFEHPYADRSLAPWLGNQYNRDLAKEAVRSSLVLLKNGILPLSKSPPRKILVAGTHANDIGRQCGGWTISWQGAAGNNQTSGKTKVIGAAKAAPEFQYASLGSSNRLRPGQHLIYSGTTILKGIRRIVTGSNKVVFSMDPNETFWQREGSHREDFSYGIVAVGEEPYAETKGDNHDLVIPAQGINIIRNVCGKMPCVVVLISGRPLVVEPILRNIDSLVAAWLPGSEAGSGIADVLFGDYDFVGKTPRTWFRSVEDLPLNHGDQNYQPLFPYGYGLSSRTT